MLKIGVLGAGHLGKVHLKCIKQIESYELVGFYDPDPATAKAVEEEMGIHCFDSVDALIDAYGAAFRMRLQGLGSSSSCFHREAYCGNTR